MTQLDTGAAPPAAPSAPEPSPAPAPDPTLQQTPADDAYIRVPKEQVAPWGGRFGEVISRAKTHDEHAEWFPRIQELKDMGINTAAEFREYWNNMHAAGGEQASETPPQTPPAPDDPDSRPLTVGDWKKLQKEMADERRTESEQAEQARATTEALAAETKFVSGLLDEIKIPEDSPQRGPMTALAEYAITQAIEKRVVPTLATYLTPEQRAKEIRDCKILATTPEDLKAAREIFGTVIKDLGNEAVASFATATNDATPSLAGGAGGPQAPNDTSKMSVEEYDGLPPDKLREIEMAEVARVMKGKGRGG